jgi:predicted nucleotide-binding protein (sugar kinase/HSP70/actin superfamily)
MNNKIPQLFAQKGVKTFFQDMLGVEENDVQNLKEVLGATKWKFAAAILAAADYTARTEGLYPVLISSFKCSPDSFAIEYFKQILDFYKKPYLILQLDEYESNVGYETRIEAALRAFSNHFNRHRYNEKNAVHSSKNIIRDANELRGKTLLLPNLGDYSTKLIEANFHRIGIDARTLYDTDDSIKRSLITNTGQCLPLSIIVQNAFDFIEENNLEPANTALWMMDSPVSCNLGMFLSYISKLLESLENRFSKMKIYSGKITFADISISTSINCYMAFLFGGYLRKLECKVRPYEMNKGQTDETVKRSLAFFYEVFKKGSSKEEALEKVIDWFKAIPVKKEQRPKVAIFGDLYVRDNDVFNQNLFRCIEQNGGEVITTPYSEYVKIIFSAYNNRLIKEGYYKRAFMRRFLMAASLHFEEKYTKYFNEVLKEPVSKPLKNYKPLLEKFNLTSSYNGESLDNALKIIHLKELYPDISLFVQTNPSYCCPSLVTEAMTRRMEKITGTPIVTIEYDGTSSGKNDDIIPYLQYAGSEKKKILQNESTHAPDNQKSGF